ncbi:PREDICTED: uncharacterized protein LOC107327152 [Acropora digitifera]|uniref:uncharacterized protein LOC107327152 n=1 Tax=Acropora digitifera TaxID=70779 RepID=UPI00077AE415|nr:PREDICTED: uncharacterized protein LOC107327152 [Acropora digitifera]
MHEGELCETEAMMGSSRHQDKLLDEKQVEKSSDDYFDNNYDGKKLPDVNMEDYSPGTGRRLDSESEKNNTTVVENYLPKRLDVSLTSNPEPIVMLECNVSNDKEKAIEIEINETIPVVPSETQSSKTRVNDSQSNILDNTKNGNQDCRNSLTPKQQDSAGMTLPKVVIQYDNEVLSDRHWYDSETSNEEAANSRSSIVGLQNKSVMQRNYSESDISLQADSDNVMDYEDGEEDLELGLDDVSSGDEDLTFEDLEYARAQMERAKGIDDLGSNQNSDNGLSDQSTRQDVIELTEADIEERDETLLQPPPMFASSDEVETEDLGEVHERENAFEFHTPSPVIPSSLLVQQPRDFKRFHNLALEVWTEEDCVDWLDYIGLGHFSPQFRANHVDGMMLKNINFQLLEEIGIDSPDEREVMLSEIYRRFHPEEEDMFEMEIQGALQSASEQERMKIMAVLNALRSPAFQAELGIAPSTGPSSPHDSYASESGSISSGMTGGSDDHYHDLAMPPPPPPPTSSQTRRSSEKDDNVREAKVKTGKLKKQRKLSKDSDKSTDKESKNEKQKQKQKKHKGMSKLLDSLSLSSSSSKLTKLFQHHSSSSSSTTPTKKLNPTMQYLLQAGPQGLIRIWPTALSEEMNYCSFMVNMTTTCAEIIKLVFEKYEVVDDQRRYYVCETSLSKGGETAAVH